MTDLRAFAGGLSLLALALTPQAGTATATPTLPLPPAGHRYATAFPKTEGAISEGGRWINGGLAGLDWTDVSTTPGLAIGHQVGASYTDATALLQGPWTANQQAAAVVYAERPNDACYQEVELRLRSTVVPHRNTGYEISFKVSATAEAYVIIVRWNGALGDFTYLANLKGGQYGVATGDVVSAAIVGHVITAYKNGVEMARATDGRFSVGNPGMGFNLENGPPGCAGTNGHYGFSAYAAAGVDASAASSPDADPRHR
jgi:hypothetical protein